MLNPKDKRIIKLYNKGRSVEQISRSIGQPGVEGIERVNQALARGSKLAKFYRDNDIMFYTSATRAMIEGD